MFKSVSFIAAVIISSSIISGCVAEEARYNSEEAELADLFAEKYDKPVEDITVDIARRVDGCTMGTVSYTDMPTEQSILWIGQHTQGEWSLLFDGTEAVPCEILESCDFTVEVIPECIDADGSLLMREKTMDVVIDEQFTISLESNQTTGYSWNADFDDVYIELIDQEYITEETEGLVGAGGSEMFTFRALQAGETMITLSYQRPWEEEPIDTRTYQVTISGM